MISVVVCTRNRSGSLRQSLASLRKAEPGHTAGEIVVIDNASVDDTQKVVESMMGTTGYPPIRYVREDRLGHSSARNRGIAEARGDWVAFTDDDIQADPEWADRLVSGLTQLGAPAGGGMVVPEFPRSVPRWVATDGDLLERIVFLAYALPGDARAVGPEDPLPVGCNMAFRADVFQKFGRFDERLGHQGTRLVGGEDTEFFDRLRAQNVPIGYVPAAVIRHAVHPERLSVRYLWRRRYWEGFGMGPGNRPGQFRTAFGIPLYYAKAAFNDLKAAAVSAGRGRWPAAVHAIGCLMNRLGATHGIWSRSRRPFGDHDRT